MKAGMIGCGKLGLPVSVATALSGHEVFCYDVVKARMTKYAPTELEAGLGQNDKFSDYVKQVDLQFVSLSVLVKECELIFIAVQTPHDREYEGITPVPSLKKDFDYSYLKNIVKQLSEVIKEPKIVVIISTVLPGTTRREILPLCNEHMTIVYNPSFIAMGTVLKDFLSPEFILVGSSDYNAVQKVGEFYGRVLEYSAAKGIFSGNIAYCIRVMSIESAELTKVAYNTFISQKLSFVNILMEICEKIPNTDIDDVTDALKSATDRLISTKYLTAGMGDGGGCHPRDNIALSWLAQKLGLGYDIFGSVMEAREGQAKWLAKLVSNNCTGHHLPAIFGYVYKSQIQSVAGSHALLVAYYLRGRYGDRLFLFDPILDSLQKLENLKKPVSALIGCNHEIFRTLSFARMLPSGSVIIDPWRGVQDSDNIRVIRLGAN